MRSVTIGAFFRCVRDVPRLRHEYFLVVDALLGCRASGRAVLVALAIPAILAPGPAVAGQTISFESIEVADNVHVFRPSELGVGNVVAIVTDTGVVVVDTSLTPAGARIVIDEIGQLTDQPVRTVVTTHAHDDHFWGNQAFRDTFPEVEFIAHTNTRRDLVDKTVPALEENRRSIEAAVRQRQATLERGTDDDGDPLSDEQREALETRLEMFRALGAEMAATEPVLPTEVFSEQMTLHQGALEIRLLYVGPGHTEGDTVVYIPARKLVVAGGLVTHPIPAAGGSMLEWPRTLERLAALDFDVLVPGHGEVQHDRTHLALVVEILDSLLEQVRQAVDRGLDLEETLAAVELGDLEARLVGEDARMRGGFRQFFLTPATETAYTELTSRD